MPAANFKLKELIDKLHALQQEAWQLETSFAQQIEAVHPRFRDSAKNLLHYLALRQHDIRELQDKLTPLGLSSLGRSEAHVLASLQAVSCQLSLLARSKYEFPKAGISFTQSTNNLKAHTEMLLGKASEGREVRIMVTFSSDLADDYSLVYQMVKAGMNCARINCAHDDARAWEKMVQHIKQVEKETGLSCKILFDLMGPKLRTGPLKPGPQVIAIHPRKNELGEVVFPAKIWLGIPGTKSPIPVDAVILVEANWLEQVTAGDKIKFKDTRGRKRSLVVMESASGGAVVSLSKSAYVYTGTTLLYKNKLTQTFSAFVGKLPFLEMPLILNKGDLLVLHKNIIPGENQQLDATGNVVAPAHISCTLPEIFSRVREGEPILFDDGEITGSIKKVEKEALLIEITAANENGSKLGADKGINLPESKLALTKMTAKDKEDLAFVVKYGDIVNLSFVNHPDMVFELQEELKKHQREQMPIMLKIETKEGFRNLPFLLLAVMRNYPAGIMIARGDLAVESGWERLAEVQEEILWFCEAAHLPVVWATQVLEKLAKKGKPSRAEITDAAMAQRADCVMLNKGPYIVPAIHMLDDILKRMQQHQYKKTAMFRSLHVSELNNRNE